MESAPKKKKHTRQIEELPYEIWNQILLCLPAITVIELKSVCKSWCELINSQHFRLSHVDRWRRIRDSNTLITWQSKNYSTTGRSALLSFDLVGDDKVLRGRPLRFDRLCLRQSQRPSGHTDMPIMDTTAAVLDCYDGLFLVRISKQYPKQCLFLFLCNPLTNSYIRLPFPKKSKGFISSHHWRVFYDPSTRSSVIFCVERSRRIYMVSSLRIELNGGDGDHGRKSANNWRQVWSSQNLTNFACFLASISIHGKAYWLFYFRDLEYGILTIDAATEESIVTKFTKGSFGMLKWNFFTSNQKFYCLKDLLPIWRETLELWAVDDVDNPTWLKHHVIIKMDLLKKMIAVDYSVILKEGNRLIIRIKPSEDVFMYDISLKKWQAVDIIGPKNLCWGYDLEFMFINYSLLRC